MGLKAISPYGAPQGPQGTQGAPGVSATLWKYLANTAATSGYPGDGYMLWDNATQINATNLVISHLTDDGVDIDIFLGAILIGQQIIVQDQAASANYQIWVCTGTPVNTNPGSATSYWTIPVALVDSGGTGTTNFPNNQQLFVAIQGDRIAIGDPIYGGTLQAVLFVGSGSVTLQQDPTNFVWDNFNNFLGIGTNAPSERLNVNGAIRLDNTASHAINFKFGNTLSNSDAALIQFVDSQVIGYGPGAVLCGLGYTNIVWGWNLDALMINSGSHIAFASGNMQASVAELFGIYGVNGVPDPGLGNDTDIAFRKDGAAVTTMYQKVSGSWVAFTGVQGAQGFQGPQGFQGAQGAQGATGPTGPKACYIENPSAAESVVIFFNPTSWVLSKIESILPGGTSTPSVTFSVKYGTDITGSLTEVVTGGITVTNTTTGLATTVFDSGTIPANNFVLLTTSAQSGTVPALSVSLS